MDIEEFEKQEKPQAKRSRLEAYQEQIFRLKDKGYANWQICKWLSTNGLTVTPEAVRKFIKSRSENASKWSKKNKTSEKPSPISSSNASNQPSLNSSNDSSQTPGELTPAKKFVFNSIVKTDDVI